MKFKDLVDIGVLRELCESFTTLTGAVTAILDLEGNILVATGWQRICTEFHRVNPQTASRCRQSDTILAGRLRDGETYNVYRCQNGLVDVAVPIHVGGEHVANFFTGQFFFEPPDTSCFRRQSEEFGFDESAYLAALAEAPIFTERQVRSMMDFLSRLAQMIGEMGWPGHGCRRPTRNCSNTANISRIWCGSARRSCHWPRSRPRPPTGPRAPSWPT